VATAYSKLSARLPGYVAGPALAPERRRYTSAMARTEVSTGLVSLKDTGRTYNAFEEDIALVHFYFGKPTTLGRSCILLHLI
jgi:hypothetical protein